MTKCPRDNIPVKADVGDPLLNSVLGERYRILERIGAGGMGQVYRAAHLRIASQFAVKVLYGDLALDPQMRARFEREAEAASCLQSRHIVRVIDFGENASGITYLVMEMLAGELLADSIAKSGHLEPSRAIGIVRQIARGLRHAHERGIVHRDLKPENVMLVAEDDDEGVVKILDFGIARIVERRKLTQAVAFLGSPAYASPEQIAGWEIDARTDLYALGVMLFEMLSGQPPFWADSLMDILRKHQMEPPPTIASVLPAYDAPPKLEGIVRKLLEKNPDHRFSSSRALIDALDDVTEMLKARRPASKARSSAPEITPTYETPSSSGLVSLAPTMALAVPRVAAAVVDVLHRTIMRGAPLYNAGDLDGCARLYRETAEALTSGPLAGPGQEALRARLLAALRRADPGDSGQAAWELRYAFDDLLMAAERLPRLASDPAARPPLLADVPEAARDLAQIDAASVLASPRYLAGHGDTVAAFYLELACMLRDRWIEIGRGAGAVALFDEALAVASGSPGPHAAAVLESAFERLRRQATPSEAPSDTTAPPEPQSRVGIRDCAMQQDVINALVHTISVGAPTYNAGDIEGCARLYLQTAERLAERLAADPGGHGVRHLLQDTIDRARSLQADEAAWTLRHAFDSILEEAYGGQDQRA